MGGRVTHGRAILVGLAAATAAFVVLASAASGAPSASGHRIGVRQVGGFGQLYDRASGRRFVPRGANYVRLDFSVPVQHVTFMPGRYQARRADRALAAMHADGYNATRVFVVGECVTGCAGVAGRRAISRAYVANVVDFLRRAKRHGLFVLITTGFPPGAYARLIGTSPLVDDVNRIYLTPGGITAFATYWRDLIRELRRQRAPLDAILAYDITNEAAYVKDHRPFSLAAGVLRAPNGKDYDLAVPADKARLMDDGLVYWVDRIRAAIRRADPTALVTASFFEPEVPNSTRQGDTRILRTRGVIERSSLDFVDLHAYPGGLPLPKLMENFGVSTPPRKPIVMGEFGAFKSTFGTAAAAAGALRDWQAQSCAYGFSGWLLWTWDSTEQTELWNATSSGGAIGKALSPKSRPDPCAGSAAATNLAIGKTTAASTSLPGAPASLAVDGNPSTVWMSGQDPPQWIDIDLGAPATVARLRLLVSQYPSGPTVHRIYGRGAAGEGYHLLTQISGVTQENQTIEVVAPRPWPGIRWIRVETVSSPSWVSWKEIEVYGAG